MATDDGLSTEGCFAADGVTLATCAGRLTGSGGLKLLWSGDVIVSATSDTPTSDLMTSVWMTAVSVMSGLVMLSASTEATTLGGGSESSAVFALAEAAMPAAVVEMESDGAGEGAGVPLLLASGAGIAAMAVNSGCGPVVADGGFCAAA